MIAVVARERVLIVVVIGVGGVGGGEGEGGLLEHHVLVLETLEQVPEVLVFLLGQLVLGFERSNLVLKLPTGYISR